jgi:hypothetical protein
LWAKELSAKDIHKETFPVYDGKCLSHKAVHGWVEKRGRLLGDDEEVETEIWKWLRQQSKDFYAVGFDALVKRWDKCIKVGGGYVEKKSFFSPSSIITCDLFIDSPSYKVDRRVIVLISYSEEEESCNLKRTR